MKHINTYKVFESIQSDVLLLKDICQDLKDTDDYDITVGQFQKYTRCIRVVVSRVDDNMFGFDPLKETFEMMERYMESEGYDSKIYYYSPIIHDWVDAGEHTDNLSPTDYLVSPFGYGGLRSKAYRMLFTGSFTSIPSEIINK